jgi:hypothetical protein
MSSYGFRVSFFRIAYYVVEVFKIMRKIVDLASF